MKSWAEADEAVESMHKRHREVRSSVGEVESHYSANDPELKCWVWATLVDTTAKLYEEFVGPISSHEQTMLYSDWVLLGQKLGIPYDSMPKDHVAFANYMEYTICSLEVTEVARAQAAYILDTGNILQTLPWIVRRVATKFIERQGKIASKVTVATLPHQLREAYGLPVLEPEKHAALRAGISRALKGTAGARQLIPWSYVALLRISRPFRRASQQIRSFL